MEEDFRRQNKVQKERSEEEEALTGHLENNGPLAES